MSDLNLGLCYEQQEDIRMVQMFFDFVDGRGICPTRKPQNAVGLHVWYVTEKDAVAIRRWLLRQSGVQVE
ncbi:MAG: hypothetical protein Q7R85_02390 [bacterium]|nr:hypothetical protein [bacterium]